jgi:hypothetical protein
MRTYNCEVCIFSKLYSEYKRTCFKYETFPNRDSGKKEGDFFAVPKINIDGKVQSDTGGRVATVIEFLNQDDFLDMLWNLAMRLPHYSAWQLLQTYFREVCPTAFVDEVMASLLDAQITCSEYKIDISIEKVRYEILGFHMELSDTLEAFNIIQGARNSYERYESERLQNESKKG